MDIEILNQLIDDEVGMYRARYGDRARYLTIAGNVFDEMTTCRPYLLIPQLRLLPCSDWTHMQLAKDGDGLLEVTMDNLPLHSIEDPWHSRMIDILSLVDVEDWRSTVHEVIYDGRPAVAKWAAFEWQMPRMEAETWAYWLLEEHQKQHPSDRRLAPQVLGHLTENGRVIGLLFEKLEGLHASVSNLAECESALQELHRRDVVHGDVNRYNFIIDKANGTAKMVDFEHAEYFDEATAQQELESLPSGLSEEGGRGGHRRVVCEE